ncbi:zinc finger protein 135-like isoform X47 [Oncorhynchus keta]|uniref:zinc finger protein 135-like isoform X45 n=1 Tax=Oncorhynchus keta TaxID=8018 RepID=UPI00227C730F|nr:zinc finger protein 135-like isoform X45 [Oncorhynchus keta]XP_052364705.1 zinc finger protein 135-like isoform X46 [Oncorhynchus keta]XP_052364707.1 zinc finger protein 135-like isoform X47 [Oncorhynchus keta]
MMSEATVTFQSQLSGVMETVFKAAMYEITRLVDDSFMKEMSRSREQVESLKKRLQLSENRRRDGDREVGRTGKCADCGRVDEEAEERSSGTSQTGVERGRGLKQEKVSGEEWSSCGGVTRETTFNDLEEAEATSPRIISEVGRGLTKHMEAEATSPRRISEVGRGLTKHMEAEATSPRRISEVGRGLTKHMEAEATSPRRISESTEVGGQKLDSLLKEEALHNTELQERWEFCLDGADGSDVSGPSKSFIQQDLQRCQDDWASGLDQHPEPPGPEGEPEDPTDPLYRPRYSMEELGGAFEKSGYSGDGGSDHLLDMEGLDRLPGSPSRLGALSYGAAGHYQVDLGRSEGGDHHHRSHMPRPHQSRREQVGSPTPSPHPEVGDRNCLLINEEGYLQDSSVLYPEHGVPESGSRAGHRGLTSIHSGSSAHNNNTESLYDAADDFGLSLNLRDRSQEQVTGGGGRRHACNQCTMTFPDFGSLKAHKQTHKTGRESGSGPPYSCTQCGKTFTQACNLKVHQRVHQAEGLHLCSHCGKGFTSFSDLKRHKCSQTTDKPYCCSICGNKFSRLWNLKLHQRIHTQEKPHRCTMCDKSFTRADILKVHLRIHTGERPYCCAVCGLRFKRLDHLKLHQRKHRPDLLN